MEDSHAVDILLEVLTVSGGRRCVNFRRDNTSTLDPSTRPPEWGDEITQHWKQQLTPQQLAIYHTELLRRAEEFLKFMDANVGPTEEFPLVIQAETAETMEVFRSYLHRLRMPVNFLLEI